MFTSELEAIIPEIRGYARMLCRDKDTADDVVQNACLKAWNARESFDPARGTFKSWMFTITRNEFLQLVRKRRPVDCYAPADFEERLVQDCELDHRSDCADAIKQLFALNPEQRDVFILVIAIGYSYEEAAEICKCSVGTIKSRINRARARLAEIREQWDAEEIDLTDEQISFHGLKELVLYAESLVENRSQMRSGSAR